MKAGFVGTGGMGRAMVIRLLQAGHAVGVYNRTPAKLAPLAEAGAKVMASAADAARFGDCIFTMLSDDAAVTEVAARDLIPALPKGGVHVCSGTHSVAAIRHLTELHAGVGQILVAAPVLGRPDAVSSGVASMIVGGPEGARRDLRPLLDAICPRLFEGGGAPVSAAALKVANNFVLGCAIEALGEAFSLVRKYGVPPHHLKDVLTEGLFACPAYKTYGGIIAEERYLPPGHRVVMGLKDCNLAMAAAETAGVPLPSGNVWRDHLITAIASGEADHDWSVMARVQARSGGLAE